MVVGGLGIKLLTAIHFKETLLASLLLKIPVVVTFGIAKRDHKEASHFNNYTNLLVSVSSQINPSYYHIQIHITF